MPSTPEIHLQQIPVAIIARALNLASVDRLMVASSSLLLTARAIDDALPGELSGKLKICQLSFDRYAKKSVLTSDDQTDDISIGDSERLYMESQSDSSDSSVPVLVDLLGLRHISNLRRNPTYFIDFDKAVHDLEPFVNNIEPGYLDFGEWGSFFWCLYAYVMSKGAKAAVLLPANVLTQNEQARIQLIRAGLIESVTYLPIFDQRGVIDAALLVLSSSNDDVHFVDNSSRRVVSLYRHYSKTEKMSSRELAKAISLANCFEATIDKRTLLRKHGELSIASIKCIVLSHGYTATIGQLFKRIPPFMPRTSTVSSDINAIEVRYISSQDFSDGVLLPPASVPRHGANGPFKIDESTFARYQLRAGDIVMPRMIGRSGAINTLIISTDDAKQYLVASHNMTVLRPSFDGFGTEERLAYSEMVAAYLTNGHGAELLNALANCNSLKSYRPAELSRIELPPALDPRTDEYATNKERYIAKVAKKHAAEAKLAQAASDLTIAKKAIADELETLCS